MHRQTRRTRTAHRGQRLTTSAAARFPTNRRTAGKRRYPRTSGQASSAAIHPTAARSRRASRAFSSYLRRTVGASTILELFRKRGDAAPDPLPFRGELGGTLARRRARSLTTTPQESNGTVRTDAQNARGTASDVKLPRPRKRRPPPAARRYHVRASRRCLPPSP